jgi:hypothetical protein
LLPRFDNLLEDCKDKCEYYKECIAGWVARKPYIASTLREIEEAGFERQGIYGEMDLDAASIREDAEAGRNEGQPETLEHL